MSNQPDSSDRPEGFETREPVAPAPPDAERPDWLVGAEDVLGGEPEPIERPKMPAPPVQGPLGVVPGGRSERPQAWSAAASSVPKLTVVRRSETPLEPGEDEDRSPFGAVDDPMTPDDAATAGAEPSLAPEPKLHPLHEPWYLVWGEAVATNRKLQIAAVALLALGALLLSRPWSGQSGTSLGGILRHPERYEGRTVAVHGEVLESFDIGDAHVFHLRQGRDTVVVFSPTRRPRLHQRLEVVGTVSTGYLDGQPRVAIFEGSR